MALMAMGGACRRSGDKQGVENRTDIEEETFRHSWKVSR